MPAMSFIARNVFYYANAGRKKTCAVQWNSNNFWIEIVEDDEVPDPVDASPFGVSGTELHLQDLTNLIQLFG